LSLISWWRWLRALRHNPVYLREKGGWGKPNPFYDKLSRFSPFVVIGAVMFGLCAGSTNPLFLTGRDELYAFWCFLCLPGILLNMLSMFGSLMAPALTAPAVSMEVNRGTWDILRVTPRSTGSILLAKMFGSLARLRILWPMLFALSLMQGMLIACVMALSKDNSTALIGVLIGLATTLKPWLEIIFAGTAGMYVSTRTGSATMALVGTYTAVLLLKLFNSSSLWIGVFSLLGVSDALLVASAGPVLIYALIITGLLWGLVRQANRFNYE
jgi:hypothetical protein